MKLTVLLHVFFFCSCIAGAQDSIPASRNPLHLNGVIGVSPGMFFNLNKQNTFKLASLGIFMDYNFGKYRHSMELDFLTIKPRKFLRNAESPSLSYRLSYRVRTVSRFDFYGGLFCSLRKDLLHKDDYFRNYDTLSPVAKGFQNILSIGPSVEVSRKVMLFSKVNFLEFTARIAYSFDLAGFGTYDIYPEVSYNKRFLKPRERFQRDAFYINLRIGWGTVIKGEPKYPEDPELHVE